MRYQLLSLAYVSAGFLFAASAGTNDIISSNHNTAVEVLVAKVPVRGWLLLKNPDELFTLRLYDPQEVPADAIHNLAEPREQRLRTRLQPGEIVRRTNLLSDEEIGRTQGYLPQNRSITIMIRGGRNRASDPFAPGMRVNICRRVLRDDQWMDRVIVPFALVEKVEAAREASKVKITKLSPEEFQRLELAVSMRCDLFIRVPQTANK